MIAVLAAMTAAPAAPGWSKMSRSMSGSIMAGARFTHLAACSFASAMFAHFCE